MLTIRPLQVSLGRSLKRIDRFSTADVVRQDE